MNNAHVFGANSSLVRSDGFVTYLTAAALFGGNVCSFATSVSSSIHSYAATVANASNNVVSARDSRPSECNTT